MNQSHLDDELLSALLDGEADADAQAHVAACPACRARGDALAGARRAVATPPPGPAADVTGRAVAAALTAWSAERDADVVVPLSELSERRGRRVPAWALGVAAAVAGLLAAVPLLTGGDDADNQQTAASPARQADSGARSGAADEAGPLDGGDLGEQSDGLALGRLLADAVGGAEAPPALSGDGAGDAASDAGSAPAPAQESAAPPSAAPQAAPPPAAPTAAAKTRSAAAAEPCADTVGTTYSTGLGHLVYTALLRWQGTPAVLLAYRLADTTGPGPDHRAFVMAREGCRLLVVQGF